MDVRGRWALLAASAGMAAGLLAGAPAAAAPAASGAATTTTLHNLAVYRPSRLGTYALQPSGRSIFTYLGNKNEVPFFAIQDYDPTDPEAPPQTTFYPEARSYLRSTAVLTYFDPIFGEYETTRYGRPGDLPVVASWNGGGPSLALFRPSNGTWYSAGEQPVKFGHATDVPAPADFAGLGKAQIAEFRPSNGTWYIHATGKAPYSAIPYGQAGDKPVPADYAGTGKAQIAVFRPSNGTWWIRGVGSVAFGQKGDIPMPADYRGDGKTEIAVFRPSNATWYVRGVGSVRYGSPGDIPLHVPPPVGG